MAWKGGQGDQGSGFRQQYRRQAKLDYTLRAVTCLLQVGLARAIGGTLAIADVASGGGKAESPEADKAAGAQSITTTPPAAPLSPSGEPFSDALNDAERQLTVPEIQSIQTRLGMRNEQISGRIDGETRSAIRDWQGRQGFANTGILTPTEIYNLRHPGVFTVNEQTSHSEHCTPSPHQQAGKTAIQIRNFCGSRQAFSLHSHSRQRRG